MSGACRILTQSELRMCVVNIHIYKGVKKGKATPITGREGSGQLRLQITRHSVVRSSPLRTGRLYPQEYPGAHF